LSHSIIKWTLWSILLNIPTDMKSRPNLDLALQHLELVLNHRLESVHTVAVFEFTQSLLPVCLDFQFQHCMKV
jgi:hypothetical protein